MGTKTQQQLDRESINRQLDEFMSRGGVIHKVDHTANATFNRPVKESREQTKNRLRGKKP